MEKRTYFKYHETKTEIQHIPLKEDGTEGEPIIKLKSEVIQIPSLSVMRELLGENFNEDKYMKDNYTKVGNYDKMNDFLS